MNIQDRQKTLTAEGLRQRYNLEDIQKTKQATQLIKDTINKIEIEFQRFMDVVERSFSEYQSQTEITVWFSNDIPTFETPSDHLGDLHYDIETGKAYELKLVGEETLWVEITDSKIAETLAIENSRADTADTKRVIFKTTPTTPYSIGDVWINNGTYYRCRCARDEGLYSLTDWIPYKEYTDDLVLLDTRAVLDQLEVKVETDCITHAQLETNTNSIYATVADEYTTKTEVGDAIVETKGYVDSEIQLESDRLSIDIQRNTEAIGDRTGKTTSITADLEQIQNIFQITGGSNLIKNSQFLLPDAVWEFNDLSGGYHTPLGSGYDGSLAGQTKAIAKIQLKNTTINTTLDNINSLVKGQTYTLNYYYKQDDLTTTTIQLINNIDNSIVFEKIYDSETSEMTLDEFQFIATYNSYTLKIETTTTSGEHGYFYLYDLMLNSGDKKTWEAAASEIYSTVLKMSQLGLQVTSTGANTTTLLNSDGLKIFAGSNVNGIPITLFDDEGMKTGKAQTTETHVGNYVMKTLTINSKNHHVEYFGGE